MKGHGYQNQPLLLLQLQVFEGIDLSVVHLETELSCLFFFGKQLEFSQIGLRVHVNRNLPLQLRLYV